MPRNRSFKSCWKYSYIFEFTLLPGLFKLNIGENSSVSLDVFTKAMSNYTRNKSKYT